MGNLNETEMPWNTPDSRAARVNAPEPYAQLGFDTYPRPVPEALMTFASDTLSAPESPLSIVLYGAQGAGKTGLGVALLRRFAEAGFGDLFQWNVLTKPDPLPLELGETAEPSPCWFERWSRLLARNRREHWDEEGWFEQLEGVTVLMLDDVGAETGTQYRQALLLRHLEWAEDRRDRRLILTLNDPPSKWKDVLGERAADRLLEQRRFLSVPVPGRSLR
jgi:DNA replication protein DnaC